MGNEYVLARIPKGKYSVGKPERRWKCDIKQVGCEDADWVHLAGFCQHGDEPSVTIKRVERLLIS